MKTGAKVLSTIGVFLLFMLIYVPIAGSRADAGLGPGILGLILFAGLIGAIRAIWKKAKEE
jgi:hypothetical protein